MPEGPYSHTWRPSLGFVIHSLVLQLYILKPLVGRMTGFTTATEWQQPAINESARKNATHCQIIERKPFIWLDTPLVRNKISIKIRPDRCSIRGLGGGRPLTKCCYQTTYKKGTNSNRPSVSTVCKSVTHHQGLDWRSLRLNWKVEVGNNELEVRWCKVFLRKAIYIGTFTTLCGEIFRLFNCSSSEHGDMLVRVVLKVILKPSVFASQLNYVIEIAPALINALWHGFFFYFSWYL